MPAYAIDPVASGGDFHLRYDGTVGGTLSDGPQLLAVNLDCNNGSQVLIGHCLVIILPQSDLASVEEHFVASGRLVLALVGIADLEPGDILGVTHAPRMCVPLDVLQRNSRDPGLSSGPPSVTPISDVTFHPSQLRRLQPRPRVSLRNSAFRSCTSGNDCCHMSERLHLTCTARTGPH